MQPGISNIKANPACTVLCPSFTLTITSEFGFPHNLILCLNETQRSSVLLSLSIWNTRLSLLISNTSSPLQMLSLSWYVPQNGRSPNLQVRWIFFSNTPGRSRKRQTCDLDHIVSQLTSEGSNWWRVKNGWGPKQYYVNRRFHLVNNEVCNVVIYRWLCIYSEPNLEKMIYYLTWMSGGFAWATLLVWNAAEPDPWSPPSRDWRTGIIANYCLNYCCISVHDILAVPPSTWNPLFQKKANKQTFLPSELSSKPFFCFGDDWDLHRAQHKYKYTNTIINTHLIVSYQLGGKRTGAYKCWHSISSCNSQHMLGWCLLSQPLSLHLSLVFVFYLEKSSICFPISASFSSLVCSRFPSLAWKILTVSLHTWEMIVRKCRTSEEEDKDKYKWKDKIQIEKIQASGWQMSTARGNARRKKKPQQYLSNM